MQTVELTVELKIPDLTALTAGSALRRRMAYGDALVELRRADYYRLSLNAETETEAVKLVEKLAEDTNLFVNPNKHRYEVHAGVHNSTVEDAEGTYAVSVLITDTNGGGGAGILEALQGRLGYGDKVAEVLAGNLWVLVVKAESREQAEAIAEAATVTRSREAGLLLNPHYQDYEMWVASWTESS
jgi:phosphoribosylformylglycinamidine (FGAM) synthase PurS component